MAGIPELVRAKIQQAVSSGSLDAEDQSAAQKGLIPLFDDLAYRYYLREDGAVFTVDALEPEAGLQRMTNEAQRLAVLRAVVEDVPELAAIIPPRPAGSADCGVCGGTGRAPVITVNGSQSSTICLPCRGTGWVIGGNAAV